MRVGKCLSFLVLCLGIGGDGVGVLGCSVKVEWMRR